MPDIPSIGVILDPSMVPSLMGAGGLLDRSLISEEGSRYGSPLNIPTDSTLEDNSTKKRLLSPGNSLGPPVPPKDAKKSPIQLSSSSLDVPRPTIIRRSSSFEERKGNKAGIGAGSRRQDTPKQALTLATIQGKSKPPAHGRDWSISTATTSDSDTHAGSDGRIRSRSGISGVVVRRPGMLRKTSSFEHRRGVPVSSRGDEGEQEGEVVKEKGTSTPRPSKAPSHARTASDSTISSTSEPSSAQKAHVRSISLDQRMFGNLEGCIRLGGDQDVPQVSQLLSALQSLTPPERAANVTLPAPNTALLNPISLLTPLAIILEALVMERTVLRNESSGLHVTDEGKESSKQWKGSLPAMTDGSKLQLDHGGGELDWLATRSYILAVGSVVSSLMPYLQSHPDTKEVGNLVKGLRMYIKKTKKVFREVATMYVEGYGFVKGFWDETGMKGSAGEVGRWSDLVDA